MARLDCWFIITCTLAKQPQQMSLGEALDLSQLSLSTFALLSPRRVRSVFEGDVTVAVGTKEQIIKPTNILQEQVVGVSFVKW